MTLPYLYREPGALPALVKIYRDDLAKAGHDSSKMDILGKFHIYVSSSLEKAIEEAAPYLDNYLDGSYMLRIPSAKNKACLSSAMRRPIDRGFRDCG